MPLHQDLKGSQRKHDGIRSVVEVRGTRLERGGDFI